MDGRIGGSIGEEDSSDDGLWSEFENCAAAVALLFRSANWRSLQTAAASTTQLYKVGLEAKKRSFEKGVYLGRQALAKEVFSLCRPYSSKIDVEDVVKLLSKYATPPALAHSWQNFPHQSELNTPKSPAQRQRSTAMDAAAGGVRLFQQALGPTPSSPASQSRRSPELNNFLQTQVHRHRKRAHPGSGGGGGNSPSWGGEGGSGEQNNSSSFKRSKFY